MDDMLSPAEVRAAAKAVRSRTSLVPTIGLILGSGLGSLAEAVQEPVAIPYADLPGWPFSSVVGHSGRLVLGKLEGQPVAVLQGRAHYYEGHPPSRLALPVRVLYHLGVRVLIVTNAAGGVAARLGPGEVMLITDHVNLLGMGGQSPLRGPNDDDFGPRFPDMTRAYDKELQDLARQAAAQADVALAEGVYACITGPSYETPAEVRFLRAIGVDAVGMSTAPEVTVARHAGMRVLGLSGIANAADPEGTSALSHEDVLAAAEAIVPKMSAIIRGVLRRV